MDDGIITAPLAVIDLQQPEEDLIPALHEACRDVGFFYVEGHGVPKDLLERAFEQSRLLFALSTEEKLAMKASKESKMKGYTAMQEETLDAANQSCGDTKEGFYVGREPSPGEKPCPMTGGNQYPDPDKLPDWGSTIRDYFAAMMELGQRLTILIGKTLRAGEGSVFETCFDRPIALLRLLHYSAALSAPAKGVFACGAHSDYGMLTILATDGIPGLQIFDRDMGTWMNVIHRDGAFIVNLGDMLQRWSNDHFRSTLHRVVNVAGKERYSMPFFYEPNFDAVVECLPQCCTEDNPPRYPPTTSGEHLLSKYATSHQSYENTVRFGITRKHGREDVLEGGADPNESAPGENQKGDADMPQVGEENGADNLAERAKKAARMEE